MTRTMYHASTTADIQDFLAGACFVDSAEIAETFLNGNAGRIYHVVIEEGTVASEDDLREAGELLGLDHAYAFEFADDARVQEELMFRGFDSVEYADVTVDNGEEFTCLRTLINDTVRVVA